MNNIRINKSIPILITLVVLAILIVPPFIVTIDAGEIGVLNTFGKISENIYQPGLHVKNPFTKVIKMSTRTQEYTMSSTTNEGVVTGDDSIQALASDGATVWLDMTAFYHLVDSEAPQVYKELGLNYDEKIIRPEIRSKIREVVSRYTVNEVFSGKRTEVQNVILEELKPNLEERGIEIEDILLRRVNLSSTLFDSIEQKLSAQQKAEQKDFEIEEAKKEAERVRIEAEGQREAQRIINESLSDRYLYLKYIESLSKNSSTVYVPTEGGVPLFKNVN